MATSKWRCIQNETISLKTLQGNIITGKLNWDEALQYPWKGKAYIDVPFVFNKGSAYLTGNESITPARFTLVVRINGNNAFEAAIRTTSFDKNAENLTTGGNESIIVQSYQLLNGQPANVWQSGNTYDNLRAVERASFTKEQVAQMRMDAAKKRELFISTPGKTKPRMMAAQTTCTVYSFSTWVSENYWNGDQLVVTGHYTTNYSMSCSTTYYDNGSSTGTGGGGGGSSYPPAPGPAPVVQPAPAPKEDPCAEAKRIADKLNDIFAKAGLAKAIKDIPNLSTEQFEQGFFIVEKRTYDPYDNTKYTSTYSATAVQKSTSTNSIDISYTTGMYERIVGFVHTHPPKGAAGPSGIDIYNMVQKGYEYITNAMNGAYDDKGYIGNFVASADGSIYGMAVSNPAFAYNFFKTKDTCLDAQTARWKNGSEIGRAFKAAFDRYYASYEGNSNESNLAFEAAQAQVLTQFEAGVAMVKYNPVTGKFEATIKDTAPLRDSNGNIVKDDTGKPKNIVTNPCP